MGSFESIAELSCSAWRSMSSVKELIFVLSMFLLLRKYVQISCSRIENIWGRYLYCEFCRQISISYVLFVDAQSSACT